MAAVDGVEEPATGSPASRVPELASMLDGWAHVNPALDTWPFRVHGLSVILNRTVERVLAPVFEANGLNGGDYEVLSFIRRRGAPFETSPTALSQALAVTTGAMTRRVDRLERSGLVRRLPHKDDRRSLVIQLTADGLQAVDRTVEQILQAAGDLLEPIREDVEVLESMVLRVLDAVEPPSPDPVVQRGGRARR